MKIQYPAIRLAIENDIQTAPVGDPARPTFGPSFQRRALLDEIQRSILEETDYLREADNLDFFGKGLSGLDYVTIPRVHRDLSSDRVLTMSYTEGGTLGEWLKQNPSPARRQLLGVRLCEMYETQLQSLRVVHADQHPGNYLFQADGRIGLVDFGCVKRLSMDVTELRRCYRDRSWRESEAEARRFVTMVYGPGVPFARARKTLPLLGQWCDALYPKDPAADIIVEFGRDAKKDANLRKYRQEYQKLILREKLINPDTHLSGGQTWGFIIFSTRSA